MLKTSYLANIKNLSEDSIKIIVMRNHGNILSPSWELLNDYTIGKIDWNQYIVRFYKEMENDECIKEMKIINNLSKEVDVYLICHETVYPCHRFLLLDIINNMED